MSDDFFPIAVWYGENRARAPMMPRSRIDTERTKMDLNNIRTLGFNCIKYWVDWATCEPMEGHYNFAQVIDLLKIAGEFDLRVVVQIYLDSAPNWVHKNYPDALYRAHTGQEVESQASPGYSLDHPIVREKAARFMTELAKIVSTEKSFLAWDIWSEPHIVNWSWFDFMGTEPWFDYNDHSRDRFVKWLREKYGDIGDLNQAWYRTYESWDEVRIPRYVTLSTFVDLLDFQKFNMQKLMEDLKWRYESVRTGDPDHSISSHSDRTSVLRVPLGRGGNTSDWLMAEAVDIWGTSFYPKHIGGPNPLDPSTKGLSIDASRNSCESYNKGFWIGELQSGPGVVGARFGDRIHPGDLANWAWTCVSRGAKGLFYYAYYPMSCGEEISGFGLVHPDGDLTDRAKEAGKVARTITSNIDSFLYAKVVPADIGVIYSPESYALLMALREKNGNLITSSIRGIYRLLFEKNIRCDFLETRTIGQHIPDSYKVLFMPFCIVMSPELAKALKDFVSRGGTLVAEFRPGWSDSEGNNLSKIPGMGLDELFGCVESTWRSTENPIIRRTDSTAGKDIEFNGSTYEETFLLTTGKEIGAFEEGGIAAVSNDFGKGKAMIFGTLFSKRYEETRDREIRLMFDSILNGSGISSEFDIEPIDREVEVRMLQNKDEKLLFIFNHEKESIGDLRIRINRLTGNYKITEVTTSNQVASTNKDGRTQVALRMDGNAVSILKIEETK